CNVAGCWIIVVAAA
ncbi:hypothetical protein SOVF_211260, partial [Spinacia oleracea]